MRVLVNIYVPFTGRSRGYSFQTMTIVTSNPVNVTRNAVGSLTYATGRPECVLTVGTDTPASLTRTVVNDTQYVTRHTATDMAAAPGSSGTGSRGTGNCICGNYFRNYHEDQVM